jgi:asparagine synthase (glutamine-hydrolysing)
MCGIAGIASNKESASINIVENIYLLSDAIKHRGMNDEGYVFFNEHSSSCIGGENTPDIVWNYGSSYKPTQNIRQLKDPFFLALAHRRLSIVDLTPGGHQPMCSSNGELWITYNGEIYNFREIRRDLENKGHKFSTQTDTEVLLYAYIEWGTEMLSRLNGMWAFVIYDKSKKKLFGSRDRFGVKPMYYSLDKDKFLFASEIKSILAYPKTTRIINKEAAFDYLATGFSEKEPESFFKGIQELAPSHFFEFDLCSFQLTLKKYYELKTNNSNEKFNSEKYISNTKEVRNLIIGSVKTRLTSEVSIGSTLSGGLDSSTILSSIGRFYKEEGFRPLNDTLHLFTSSFPDSDEDETHWAELVYKENKEYTKWNKDIPSVRDIPSEIEKLVAIQDIPFYSLSAYSHYHLMKKVKEEGVKVLLDGQGGDELMAGYNIHFSIYLKELIKTNSIEELYKNLSFKGGNSFSIKNSDLLFLLKNTLIGFSKNKMINRYQTQLTNKYFFKEDFSNLYPEKINALFSRNDKGLNDFLKEQFTGPDLKTLLRVCDRNAMAYSIENRTPFADDISLIEKLFSIPSVYKIRNNLSKSLLRDSMAGIIPDKIKNRTDKIGFATPEYKWFKSNEEYFLDHFNGSDEFINYSKIKENWSSYDSILKTDISRLWRITNFLLWRKVYNV